MKPTWCKGCRHARRYIAKQKFGRTRFGSLCEYERGRSALKRKYNLESTYRPLLEAISECLTFVRDDDIVGRLMSAVFSPTERWTVVKSRLSEVFGRVSKPSWPINVHEIIMIIWPDTYSFFLKKKRRSNQSSEMIAQQP